MSHRKDFGKWWNRGHDAGDAQAKLALFHHNDVFAWQRLVSKDTVVAEHLSEAIRLACWADGHALMVVTAFRHHVPTWIAGDGLTSTLAPWGGISLRHLARRTRRCSWGT